MSKETIVNDKGSRVFTHQHRGINGLSVIARLGGYLNRAGDPPPGNMVVWRGMSKLNDINLGFLLGTKTCG